MLNSLTFGKCWTIVKTLALVVYLQFITNHSLKFGFNDVDHKLNIDSISADLKTVLNDMLSRCVMSG